MVGGDDLTLEALLGALPKGATAEQEHERLAIRVVVSALRARQARQVMERGAVRGDILAYALS
jgi:hypothetical protein